MNKKWEQQKNQISKITKALRSKFYEAEADSVCEYNIPFGTTGILSESIGAWPEFILQGTFCKRSLAGKCSPCFYAQFPLNNKPTGQAYSEMIKKQYDYILSGFDSLVLSRQYGSYSDGLVRLAISPTGSFFDNTEFPQELRIDMLNKLLSMSEKKKVNIGLYVESHCIDWNNYNTFTAMSRSEIELLKRLNTSVLFGFESMNEYTRNVLYNKAISINEFCQACRSVKDIGLNAGAFIFAGLFSMNNWATLLDVKKTIDFAIGNGLIPVLMFQNIQQFTISELLLREGKIKMLEPFTVMDIVLYYLERIESFDCPEWLIADPKGGPPAPKYNIFDCSTITTKENADSIYNMICELRLSKDMNAFRQKAYCLQKTDNYKLYRQHLLSEESNESVEDRTDELLSYLSKEIGLCCEP